MSDIYLFLIHYFALIVGIAILVTISVELFTKNTDYRTVKILSFIFIICAIIVVLLNDKIL